MHSDENGPQASLVANEIEKYDHTQLKNVANTYI